MSHDHAHHRTAAGSGISRKLGVSALATLLLVIAELVAAWRTGSLALAGDAFHNFTDTLALVIALAAVHYEQRPPTGEKSFGYRRAGILAAFVNAGTLVALTVYLILEAIARLRHPTAVNANAMLAVACVAFLLNATITVALRREGESDLNIRSAVLHMLGDAVSSVGIIVAAVLIRATGSPRWDGAVSLLIAALLLWSSWGILTEAVNLLLEGTPNGIDPQAVTRDLAKVAGIRGVHHLHIWALGPSHPSLSCHLMVGDVPLRSTASILDQVTSMLHDRHGIMHVTVQFEYADCNDDDPFCIPFTS